MTTTVSIFTQDIHSEYIDTDGSVIWGFTELDMAADMHGLDDLLVARCENCGGQLFTSTDDHGEHWLHVTEGKCDEPAPIW